MDIQEEIKRAIEIFKGHNISKDDIKISIIKGRAIFKVNGFSYCESLAKISTDENNTGLSKEEVIAANVLDILKFIDDVKTPGRITEDEYECIGSTEAPQYASITLLDDINVIISAEEAVVFNKYMEYAKNGDTEVVFNKPDFDEESYKLVYGGLIPQCDREKESALDWANDAIGECLIDIEEEQVNISLLEDIKFFETENKEDSVLIPFVALMKTQHNISKKATRSKTLFPYYTEEKFTVADNLLGRPFLLACRYTECLGGLTKDNWTEYISQKRLIEAFSMADKVFIADENLPEEE